MSTKLVAGTSLASPRPSGAYRLISALVIFFLFSFKINIVSVGEAGIRLDDVLFIPGAFLVLYSLSLTGVKIKEFYLVYLVFCGYCLLSSAIASLSGRVDLSYSVLFVLRLVQYSIFYFFGIFLGERQFPLGSLLKVYTLFLAVLIPFQYFGLIPVPGDFGTDRASGNTNGPYELAAISSFLFFYFLHNLRVNWVYCLLSLAILYLTASRITIAAVLIVLLVTAIRKSSAAVRLFIFSGLSVVLVITLALGLSFSGERSESSGEVDVVSRLAAINMSDLTSLLMDSYRSSPAYKSSGEYIDGTYIEAITDFFDSAGEVDVSAAIRFTRWASLIKSSLASVETSLLGLGPSFGSIAIDGYLVRLLVETGFLGFAIFSYFIFRTYRWTTLNDPWLTNYLTALLFTSFFIDIFMSYKPMMLLWLALGFLQAKDVVRS